MYKIYELLPVHLLRYQDLEVFPSHLDFTTALDVKLTKNCGRFTKGRPVVWEYTDPRDDSPVVRVSFPYEDWAFDANGMPTRRPFRIYFYTSEGTISTIYKDMSKPLTQIAAKQEGVLRRSNVIDQLTVDVATSLVAAYVSSGMDMATASSTAITQIQTALGSMTAWIENYKTLETQELSMGLQTAMLDWLDLPFIDYTYTPTGQTVREYMLQELSDTV